MAVVALVAAVALLACGIALRRRHAPHEADPAVSRSDAPVSNALPQTDAAVARSDELAADALPALTAVTAQPLAELSEALRNAPGTEAVEVRPAEEPADVTVRPVSQVAPEQPYWKLRSDLHTDGRPVESYAGDRPIHFGEHYTDLEGVITFRGDNLRGNAAYGSAALERGGFKVLWKHRIGAIDSGYAKWTGVGWTGQPVLVRWPEQLRRIMNIDEAHRADDALIEVIYGTLDGRIYFLDARTGNNTREPIELGFPIKGSVSIDPRGYPLLYVGQGISRANGRTGKIGWRVYSLIDQRELYFLDGHDSLCYRDHGAFDGACIVDGEADTVFEGGENGLFYAIRLNTVFDPAAPGISVHPQVTAYRYRSAVSGELGIENSVAAYGHYAWFADNSGLMTCLDLNTMSPVCLFNVGDDTDSTIALEREPEGGLALYTVNQVDKQGTKGRCTIRRVNALEGVVDWSFSVTCESDGENGGGGFASPVIGEGAYADDVFFNVCRTEGGGTLYCFDKRTGAVKWSGLTGSPSWSSPVLVYRPDGTGALIVGNAGGRGVLSMYDPATGRKLGSVELQGKLEASPAVFGDILVVGTRDMEIYGVRLL